MISTNYIYIYISNRLDKAEVVKVLLVNRNVFGDRWISTVKMNKTTISNVLPSRIIPVLTMRTVSFFIWIWMCSYTELLERYSLIFRSEKSMYYQWEYLRIFFLYCLFSSFSLPFVHLFSVASTSICLSFYIQYDKVASFLKMLNILFMPFSAHTPAYCCHRRCCATSKVSYVSVVYEDRMDKSIEQIHRLWKIYSCSWG